MPLFVCDTCHTIDNTALGWYWQRDSNRELLGPSFENGHALCRSCVPKFFSNGSVLPMSCEAGFETREGIEYHKWHNSFDRERATVDFCMEQIALDNLCITKAVSNILSESQLKTAVGKRNRVVRELNYSVNNIKVVPCKRLPGKRGRP